MSRRAVSGSAGGAVAAVTVVLSVVVTVAVSATLLSACGSSSSKTTAAPSATSTAPSTSPSASPSTAAPSTAAISSAPPTATASLASGVKSAACVNGWVQPAPGSDFYKQATAALDQAKGSTGYVVKSVRYFAGPVAGGGIGAIYYLDVRDPRLSSRVLLVSGAGPAAVAVAKTGTTGWKAAEWTAPGGGASTVQLTPSVAGCLDGT